jgi:ketosteroid isomerase-like protein
LVGFALADLHEIPRDELRAILDEAACRKVLSLYGPSLDWRDPSALARMFWPDALIDYGFFKGNTEEYVRVFIEIERAAMRPFHLMTCERITLHGTVANAESLGIALTIETATDGTSTARQYWGRYLDALEKRGSEWRIIRRTYLVHGVFDVATPPPGSLSFGAIHVADNLTTSHPRYEPR